MMYTDIAEHAKYLQNIPNCSKVHLNALKEERLHDSKLLHNFAYSKSIKYFSNVFTALYPCKVKNQLKYKRQ